MLGAITFLEQTVNSLYNGAVTLEADSSDFVHDWRYHLALHSEYTAEADKIAIEEFGKRGKNTVL
jgi:hypothetical protein